MQILLQVVSFIFGSAVGSFLNVCIYRLPRGESIISPRSHCPHCNLRIVWYDNIPLISYLALRGKCRHCSSRIRARYFIVEFLTAFLFLLLFRQFWVGPHSDSLKVLIYLIFTCGLIIATFTDFEHWIIPDVVTYPGLILGLILSTVYLGLQRTPLHWSEICTSPWEGLFASLIGAISGGAFLYSIGIIGEKAFKKEAMGGGDVKLLAMVGAFLGWQMVVLTIFLSSLFGSAVGIIIKMRKGQSYIPYGPYLALGAIISLLWGERLVNWYFKVGG